MIRTAVISSCGQFRYRLGRQWAADLPLLAFVMLNPSTADASEDDATIRRCIRFAADQDFGGIDVVNLFAYRATKPADLRCAGYPVGPANDHHISEAAAGASAVCLAWGANAADLERPQVVLPLIRAAGAVPRCLGITGGGHPAHPLMLPASRRLTPFTAQAIHDAMHSEHA